EIESLTSEKNEIEERLSSNRCQYEEITRMSQRISEIIQELEVKEERWLELSCL
ncbi:MAG: hypothetical protein IAB81_06590, partial [Bacteroidetes bacterium]|nr:hypothetical protein [Candidatus Merdivivens pullicola]